MLYGKSVVLGVTGSIAAYKACEIASSLVKKGANVDVILTKNAAEFVTPLTFETLTKNKAITDTFDRDFEFDVKHVSLAKKGDVFVVAPASADVIAKLANGIADDMLTTTLLAVNSPIIVCPAMNTNMYEAKQTEENLEKLKKLGYIVLEPVVGNLACGDVGKGKMASPEDIVKLIEKTVSPIQDFDGKTVLVTAGATREPIDGVRYISNSSSGKMGFEIAKAVQERGGKVILVKGFTTAQVPNGIFKTIYVETTAEMYDAVLTNLSDADIVIKAAAPSDYKVKNYSNQKIKAETLTLELEKNPDIAKAVGEVKGEKKLVIFSAETENLQENATKKLYSKNADMVVANDVTMAGAGFNVDTNIVTLITRSDEESLPVMSKRDVANAILDRTIKL
ncbi:MAG: bifunctional phosphopantothenoylcysteine decarboxylase/phosphopantothenate--cysteine ligase CoaBC [Firmicutes bacterium]|nr:bifunctional phosphopantothenoylcysteine decarboxylase/phosphopantothenate--cysteine ligase CoaBC [Bacillota bacterium]MDY4559461.1 bifunctional phosphopantothenoylcysteine decarboxylase/phosphopantothenate--cysteine ligase CoaBC [Eubacteriales bacterium]